MATYRSTRPLQVQFDLFAAMEKYQPVEFDKNTSTKTTLSSFSSSSRTLFFFFSFLLEPGVPPEARRQWLTFHRLARRKILLVISLTFKKDYQNYIFGSVRPTVILHLSISVRGASGLLPGKTKPHKTYRPVSLLI